MKAACLAPPRVSRVPRVPALPNRQFSLLWTVPKESGRAGAAWATLASLRRDANTRVLCRAAP